MGIAISKGRATMAECGGPWPAGAPLAISTGRAVSWSVDAENLRQEIEDWPAFCPFQLIPCDVLRGHKVTNSGTVANSVPVW